MKPTKLFKPAILILIAVFCHLAIAGTTGKITGRIVNSENKEPIPGSRVIIEGTKLGTVASLFNGHYEIDNVPPGTYTLIASCVGFAKLTVKNITVYPYAHLSSSLSTPEAAMEALKLTEEKLRSLGFEVHRAPFGWYKAFEIKCKGCLLYTSPSPRDLSTSRMPSSA